MPELPEVESVCRSLRACVVGRRVRRVELNRPDIVTGDLAPPALLEGRTIAAVARHGKQIALLGDGRGPACLCIHLGMSGSLRFYAPTGAMAHRKTTSSAPAEVVLAPHSHLLWHLDGGGTMVFRDPRRFGGVWTYPSPAALMTRWQSLGPDALRITPRVLARRLQSTARPIKAALLDQRQVAGLGNIYVDELLFACRVHPLSDAFRTAERAETLVRAMRRLLKRAITAGGSTLRDYVNSRGEPGGFQLQHRVYGRAGMHCLDCGPGGPGLQSLHIAGRTTVFCPRCQTLL